MADTTAIGALRAWLSCSRWTIPPTAVFAGGDGIAEGIYHVCKKAGVRIPQDLSVVGFDDTPVAPHMDPPLTSVRQPLAQMGSIATAALLDQLDAGSQESRQEARQVVLPASLIVRDSTAPASDSIHFRHSGQARQAPDPELIPS